MKSNNVSGFSLIEIMVVLVVLPVIALISTQALINVLSAQKKIESEVQARQGLEQIFSYFERNIFNAQDVICPNPTTILFEKDVDTSGQFVCNPQVTSGGFIVHYPTLTSSAVQLNDAKININRCIFTCIPAGAAGSQPGVRATIGVNYLGQESIESGHLESTRTFHTRSY